MPRYTRKVRISQGRTWVKNHQNKASAMAKPTNIRDESVRIKQGFDSIKAPKCSWYNLTNTDNQFSKSLDLACQSFLEEVKGR